MIFQATWQQVLAGTKTQTRRIVKPNESMYTQFGITVVMIDNGKIPRRHKWETGRTYAVQPGRGQKAIGRIKLLAIRHERLLNITDKDAWAEGCSGRSEFSQLWEQVHGKGAWQIPTDVWVLEFELAQEA